MQQNVIIRDANKKNWQSGVSKRALLEWATLALVSQPHLVMLQYPEQPGILRPCLPTPTHFLAILEE